MQSDHKELYKLTAARTGKSEQVYKDIGNAVFADLYSRMRRPKSLIIKLKGVGSWYMRRMRMQKTIELFPPDYSLKEEDFKHPLALLAHENKKEIHDILRKRLEEYDEYIRIRDEIRVIRRKTQTLIIKDDAETR